MNIPTSFTPEDAYAALLFYSWSYYKNSMSVYEKSDHPFTVSDVCNKN